MKPRLSVISPKSRQRGFGETKAQDTAAGLVVMAIASIPLLGGWFGAWADWVFGTLWGLGFAFGWLGGHGFLGLFMYRPPGTVLAWLAVIVSVLGVSACLGRVSAETSLRKGLRELLGSYEPALAKGCGSGGGNPDASAIRDAASAKLQPGSMASAGVLSTGPEGQALLTITLGAMERVGADARRKIPSGSVLVYEARCSRDRKQLDWKLARLNELPPEQLPGNVRRYLLE